MGQEWFHRRVQLPRLLHEAGACSIDLSASLAVRIRIIDQPTETGVKSWNQLWACTNPLTRVLMARGLMS